MRKRFWNLYDFISSNQLVDSVFIIKFTRTSILDEYLIKMEFGPQKEQFKKNFGIG